MTTTLILALLIGIALGAGVLALVDRLRRRRVAEPRLDLWPPHRKFDDAPTEERVREQPRHEPPRAQHHRAPHEATAERGRIVSCGECAPAIGT